MGKHQITLTFPSPLRIARFSALLLLFSLSAGVAPAQGPDDLLPVDLDLDRRATCCDYFLFRGCHGSGIKESAPGCRLGALTPSAPVCRQLRLQFSDSSGTKIGTPDAGWSAEWTAAFQRTGNQPPKLTGGTVRAPKGASEDQSIMQKVAEDPEHCPIAARLLRVEAISGCFGVRMKDRLCSATIDSSGNFNWSYEKKRITSGAFRFIFRLSEENPEGIPPQETEVSVSVAVDDGELEGGCGDGEDGKKIRCQ